MREDEDVVLKLLHTADWHLGKRFSFESEQERQKLSRARLEVIKVILDTAERHSVDAVLCAGDLFDDPHPEESWWGGLAELLGRSDPKRPIFLLPGNHDPLRRDSVYDPKHPFRGRLPPHVHVIDRKNFTYELKPDAVLYASPCTSAAGQEDLALALPSREPGDYRVRVGMVHGTTFDMPGFEANFPISRDAAVLRGFDYLAIGDTHAYRDVQPEAAAPTVYPGAPEATNFGERDTGNVAIVLLFHHGKRAHVHAVRVGRYRWREETCRDLETLRRIHASALAHDVLRLRLEMSVTIRERAEVERMLAELKGTLTIHPRAGVVQVDASGLKLVADAQVNEFPTDLPETLKSAVAMLQRRVATDGEKATRALYQLWKLVQTERGA
jgi:DNA repair exonuclease SbcCD nuclease subunit